MSSPSTVRGFVNPDRKNESEDELDKRIISVGDEVPPSPGMGGLLEEIRKRRKQWAHFFVICDSVLERICWASIWAQLRENFILFYSHILWKKKVLLFTAA